MGKQIDATVFYCDKCKKAIIGTPNVLQHEDFFSTAHGILPEQDNALDSLPFGPNAINRFMYPELNLITGNSHQDGSHDLHIKVENKIKYYCSDCAEKITEEYLKITNELQNLFI